MNVMKKKLILLCKELGTERILFIKEKNQYTFCIVEHIYFYTTTSVNINSNESFKLSNWVQIFINIDVNTSINEYFVY